MKECKECGQVTDRYYSKKHKSCIKCFNSKRRQPKEFKPLIRRAVDEIKRFILSDPHDKMQINKLLGCHHKKVRNHIESQFVEGMTWDSYGGWHLTHIEPLSSAMTIVELRKLLKWDNLRPLWAEISLKKGRLSEDDLKIINEKKHAEYLSAMERINKTKTIVMTDGELKSYLSDMVYDDMTEFALSLGYKKNGDYWIIKQSI
jgi:hypothetical protein